MNQNGTRISNAVSISLILVLFWLIVVLYQYDSGPLWHSTTLILTLFWLCTTLILASCGILCYCTHSGSWFNIKMSSYQYRKTHCGDKTILRPSYLHNGISYTGKMTSLYWIGALGPDSMLPCSGQHVSLPDCVHIDCHGPPALSQHFPGKYCHGEPTHGVTGFTRCLASAKQPPANGRLGKQRLDRGFHLKSG